MANTKSQGCLAAILGLIGIRLTGPTADERLPYRQRDDSDPPLIVTGREFVILRRYVSQRS